MKKTTLLALFVSLYAVHFSASANGWIKYGQWLLDDDLSISGQSFWDRSIMFDINSASLSERARIKSEIEEVSNSAGVNYRYMDKTFAAMENQASDLLIDELKLFSKGSTKQQLEKKYYLKKYLEDKSKSQVFIFSHKTNQNVQGMVMNGYRQLNDLLKAQLNNGKYLKECTVEKGSSSRCGVSTTDRFSSTQVKRINETLRKSYGVDLSNNRNSMFLYNDKTQELIVVQTNQRLEATATLYSINVKTLGTAKPVNLKELPKL